ncbi:hypothetical protein HPB51_018876 [Rhipicephalus microplus]|uniref:Uncharacterized protein n=1 Tax=Rhipicephalus microplus TaxID=6941 RepID=A0A9J6D6D0_RHIMP|nr:hypothetical protein HPB51_018876 [Rhipicephalus microplus]
MPPYAALKRAERKKSKAMARRSFASTSRAFRDQPSRRKADLSEQSTSLEEQQKSQQRVLRGGNSDGRTKSAACKLYSRDLKADKAGSDMHTAEPFPHCVEPLSGSEWEDSPKKSAVDSSSFNSEGSRITSVEAMSDALSDCDAANISRLLRKYLKKNGPSLEKDLLSALRPSQVQYVIHAYGTLTAFMDCMPEFERVQEGRCTLVCHEGLDGEECDCSDLPHTQEEHGHGLHSNGSSYDGLQHADDSEPECEPCSSTSSSCYESAVEEQPEEAKHRLKDASCQTLLSCYSRGVQAVQNTSHADSQTDESHACRCVKAKSTQQSRDAEVKKLRERLKNIRQNQGREIQQLRLKIKQLLAKPQAATPQHGASNRTVSRERKPADKNRTDDRVSPPQPRPPLRQKNLPARLIPENMLMTHPVEPKSRPLKQAGRQCSRSETPLPAQEVHEVPGCKKSAEACTDVVSVRSSQGNAVKSSTDMQISRIVRMAMKRQPDLSETEIREVLSHLRLTKGGFSGMTFSAIVDLALGQLKAGMDD